MSQALRVVALVPARKGSKRVAGKNVRRLCGHPLLAHAIVTARASGVFDDVVCSTDAEDFAAVARYYGAEVPFLRPAEYATETSPDVEWVAYTIARLRDEGRDYDAFSILRPTNPFRRADTIRRAWGRFCELGEKIDSLRAVSKCSQHPGKMWVVEGEIMRPLLEQPEGEQPWHSRQYASLPEVYAQNASLEIARSRVVAEKGTIAGDVVAPFLTQGFEGFDINDELDWLMAETLIATGEATLPEIDTDPYPSSED